MRTILQLAFDGTPFCGWQVQPKDRTAQGDLERALSLLLQQTVTTVGAGRTDTGVHAKQMYVHFDWEVALAPQFADLAHLQHRLNRFLDPAIHVQRAFEAPHPEWHARFDALSRTYHYDLCANGSPFMRHRAWMVHEVPNFEAMNQAAALLLEEHDFASFCKSGSDNKTTLCKVSHARWTPVQDHYQFTITADRFLRNMVRAVVGSLLEVGRGNWTIEQFAQRLAAKNRGAMGTSAPAHGLYLAEITYKDI